MAGNFNQGLMQCRWCDNANESANACQRCKSDRCRVPQWPLQMNGCILTATSGYSSSSVNLGGGTFGTKCCAQYSSESLGTQYTSPLQCGIDGFMRWSLTEQYAVEAVPVIAVPGGFQAYDRVPVRNQKAFASYSANCGWAYRYFIQDVQLNISRQRYYGTCLYFLDLRIRGEHRFGRTQIGNPVCGSQTFTNYLPCLQGTNVAGCTTMAPWRPDDCTVFESVGISTYPFTLSYSTTAANLLDPIVFSQPYTVRPMCGLTMPATARSTYLGHDFRPESGAVPIDEFACDLTAPSGTPPAVRCNGSPGVCPVPSTLGPVPGGLCAWIAGGGAGWLEVTTEVFNRVFETRPGIGATAPTLPDFGTWTLTL